MVLTAAKIQSKAIVQGAAPDGWRASTYDATVGCIIRGGVELTATSFTLPPRSIVWVVSAETFNLTDDVTGLATLKTQWTHRGVLALNVGVVDPGWNGPLAAALVNFGNTDFTFSKGDQFLRLLFHDHDPTGALPTGKTMNEYKKDTIERSRLFSPTFLSMESLTREVSDEVLRLPRWGYIFTIVAVLLSFLAIFAPIAISVWTDYYVGKPRIDLLEGRVKAVEDGLPELRKPSSTALNLKRCDLKPKGKQWEVTCIAD